MAENRVQDELDDLKADIASLREDVSGLTEALREVGAERVSEARHSAEARWDDARERLRSRARAAGARGRHYADEVEQGIGEHPFGTLAAAVGVGFIIGRLLDMGGRR